MYDNRGKRARQDGSGAVQRHLARPLAIKPYDLINSAQSLDHTLKNRPIRNDLFTKWRI
jgi:hypothetical protein